MIHLVQSIWLWAIAGIAVPLFIHLWNVKKGKTRKVGSIAFLTESAKSHTKSLRISEWLLLLLRCLLLIVLALLLTNPFIETPETDSQQKGWILIDKQEVKQAYRLFAPTIDSLLQQGYVFHYFNPGFTEAKIADTVQADNDSAKEKIRYWTRLQNLDQRVPTTLPVYLFTSNRLEHFNGTRPSVALNLHWKTYTPADTSFSNSSFKKDTAITTICIYTDKPGMGDHYIKAALEAIRDQAKRKIVVTVAQNTQNIPKGADWVFWLSDNTIPNIPVKKAWFVYGRGKAIEALSPVLTGDGINVSAEEGLRGYKMIQETAMGTPVWTNGNGETILNKENTIPAIYHFYSRFDPQWNDMVWSAKFPQLLYDLLFNSAGQVAPVTGIIDEKQLLPMKNETASAIKKELLHKTGFLKPLWILAFILFLAERLLVYREKKEVVYG